ncbi:MAG: HAD family phosphatase [Terriglobia bacterium]
MLRAVIFDFNGVIIDDEPFHFLMFQKVLREEGVDFSKEEYFGIYLGLDDKGCFAAVLRDRGRLREPSEIMELVERKAVYYLQELDQYLTLFPGVPECVARLAASFRLAICSGARQHEIEIVLGKSGLKRYFQVIISADQIHAGKPDPGGYLATLGALRQQVSGLSELKADECLVIEDAPAGIQAAHAAGMRCLAVTNSRRAEDLAEAELVVGDLGQVHKDDLLRLFRTNAQGCH